MSAATELRQQRGLQREPMPPDGIQTGQAASDEELKEITPGAGIYVCPGIRRAGQEQHQNQDRKVEISSLSVHTQYCIGRMARFL